MFQGEYCILVYKVIIKASVNEEITNNNDKAIE
jgi:hypothetical protein